MEVTVLPSPETVGVVAVTRINLPRRRAKAGSERSSSFIFPAAEPSGSKYLSGKPSLAAIC